MPVTCLFDTVFIDLITPLHESADGNKNIVTLVDSFTRYGIAKAYSKVKTETIIDFVLNKVILKHGPIRTLTCDNGSVFKAELFQAAMKRLRVKIHYTTPYHRQANGRVERWNGTLKSIIKKYADDNQSDWDVYLKRAVNIYNNTIHEATLFSPYELVYGRASRSVFSQQDQRQIQFKNGLWSYPESGQ